MPLSPATGREPIHTRKVTCEAYHRADDLIDIEGHLTDVKNYPVPNTWRGELAPGTPIHDMWLRLTIDHDFVIQDVEAVTDASPFQICPAVTVNFQRLKGVRIGPGWRKVVHQKLGGVEGCTHLVELLGPMATTAYQATWGLKSRKRRNQKRRAKDEQVGDQPPRLLNNCWAYSDASEVVREHYPDFYRGPAPVKSA